ncbi:hypothetical protein PIB30_080210 [Stylosanthes scabra]|uniref:Uncharacterized protein n=1 Tax=Stylosanthes scabra TaxID=79078 RepID=A0ABU6WSH9_9FABA|nr:hypothetical protein [Stylosanthes scabra]
MWGKICVTTIDIHTEAIIKVLRTSLEAQFLRNKAVNKWHTSKEESFKIGKIRCSLNKSHKDLNYLAIHLHINPFSAIALGYAVELVTKGTSSYLEYRDLASHSKSFGQSLRDRTLTLVLSVGNSYSRDKKCSVGDPSERWTTKCHSTMGEQPTAVTRNRLRKRKSIKGTKPSRS